MYINSTGVADMVGENTIDTNTFKAIMNIVHHIKAFYGDIYGPFIHTWRILGDMRNEVIKMRIDTMTLPIFLNVLSMTYTVTDEVATTQGEFPINYSSKLHPKIPGSHKPISIVALLSGKKAFKFIVPDLDINLLTEDDCSLYVRNPNVPNMRYVLDKITFLKERICSKRFCAVQRFPRQRIVVGVGGGKDMTSTIEEAKELVLQGWVMDDCFIGEDAWMVSNWGVFVTNPKIVRTKLTDARLSSLVDNDECALCQEKFNQHDIVVLTSCHHAFHWECPGKDCGGLKTWVQEHNRQACPCCRSLMF